MRRIETDDLYADDRGSVPVCGFDSTPAASLAPDRYAIEFKARYVACRSCGTLRQSPMPGIDKLISLSGLSCGHWCWKLAGMRQWTALQTLALLPSADARFSTMAGLRHSCIAAEQIALFTAYGWAKLWTADRRIPSGVTSPVSSLIAFTGSHDHEYVEHSSGSAGLPPRLCPGFSAEAT